MLPFTRRKRLSALTLLIFGVGLVVYGYYIIIQGQIDYENVQKESLSPKIRDVPFLYVSLFSVNNVANNLKINTSFDFKSLEVFAVDNLINYTIETALPYPTDVKQIVWIVDNQNHDLEKSFLNNTNQLIEEAKVTGSFINLTKTSPTTFSKSGFFTEPNPEEVTMIGFMILENKSILPLGHTGTVLTIDSALSLLQAQTNRDLIKQIHSSDLTNAKIEGLTIIIIGLIPLGFVAEIVIERWFVGQ